MAAIVFSLVESSPYLLKYLATTNGEGSSGVIPNNGGLTADLRTDILATLAAYGSVGLDVVPDPSLNALIFARINGYGPIPAGTPLTQAQARAIFNSDESGSPGFLNNMNLPRAILSVYPRSGESGWGVDADVDVDGDPVIKVTSGQNEGDAYVEIRFLHTEKL
jgi:hypothetical protein